MLRPFVSTAMSSLLGSCPGLAARLFGDVVPIGPGTPLVHAAVPASSDLRLDIVIEGEDGVRLLIENQIAPAAEWFEERSEARPSNHVDNYIAAARHRYGGRARVLARLLRRYPNVPAADFIEELEAFGY